MAQENPPSATNAERVESNSAGGLKLASSVPQPRRTARFDSRRTLARRRIGRELDEWFGIFAYPDPSEIYAIAPSRAVALDG